MIYTINLKKFKIYRKKKISGGKKRQGNGFPKNKEFSFCRKVKLPIPKGIFVVCRISGRRGKQDHKAESGNDLTLRYDLGIRRVVEKTSY